MGDTDGVDAHVLQNLHLALHGTIPCLGTQCTLVVVHTDALEFQCLAVQVEASLTVELDGAETQIGIQRIGENAVHIDFSLNRVEVGIIHAPQVEVGQQSGALQCGGGLGGHGAIDGIGGGYHFAIGIQNLLDDGDAGGLCGVVVHHGGHIHSTNALGKVGRGDGDTVASHMDVIGGGDVDAAVDTTTRVPAAAGNRVVGADGNHIFTLEVQDILGQLEGECGVAIGVGTQLNAVQIDGGVHVGTAEVDGDGLVRPAGIDIELLAIPAYTAQFVAALGLTS